MTKKRSSKFGGAATVSRGRRHVGVFRLLPAALLFVCGGCGDFSPSTPDSVADGEPRVISLAPNLTEMIIAIGAGDQLVGRSSACDYPAAALKNVPVVGGFGEPSMEVLLAQRPTLIVDVALADQSLQHRLRQAGLHREHIPCTRLDEIPAALRRLGRLLQREEAARTLADELEDELTRLRRQAARIPDAHRPLVFAEVWSEPLMTVGRSSFISECIRLAGGRNLGDENDTEYYYLSHERVVERNPDVILLLYMAEEKVADRIATRIGWESLNAVRNRRIHDELDPDLIMRPGPRVLQGIAQMRRAIVNPDSPAAKERSP